MTPDVHLDEWRAACRWVSSMLPQEFSEPPFMSVDRTQSREEFAERGDSRGAGAPKAAPVVRGGKAGAAYGIILVSAGFALSTLRVVFVAPLLGAATALVLELVIILIVSWSVARWCATTFRVPKGLDARLAMAAVAFTVVVGVDWVVAVFAFQETTTRFLESYMTVAGLIGLCAQIAFACFPIFQAREREQG